MEDREYTLIFQTCLCNLNDRKWNVTLSFRRVYTVSRCSIVLLHGLKVLTTTRWVNKTCDCGTAHFLFPTNTEWLYFYSKPWLSPVLVLWPSSQRLNHSGEGYLTTDILLIRNTTFLQHFNSNKGHILLCLNQINSYWRQRRWETLLLDIFERSYHTDIDGTSGKKCCTGSSTRHGRITKTGSVTSSIHTSISYMLILEGRGRSEAIWANTGHHASQSQAWCTQTVQPDFKATTGDRKKETKDSVYTLFYI